MVPFESLVAVSYSHSIVTMVLSCIISEIKRDIGQKSRFFSYSLHAAIRGSQSEYSRNVYGKLEWCGYSTVKTTLRICLAISMQHRLVTDRQTSFDSIVRAMHSIAR